MNYSIRIPAQSRIRLKKRKGVKKKVGVVLLYVAAYTGFLWALRYLDEFDYDLKLMLCLAAGGITLFKAWRFDDWQGGRFVFFGPLILISSVGYRVASMGDVMLSGDQLDHWPSAAFSTLPIKNRFESVLLGEWLTVTGLILVAFFWKLNKGVELSVRVRESRVAKSERNTLQVMYVFALLVIVLSAVLKVGFGAAAQIVFVVYFLGISSIIIAKVERRGSGAGSSLAATLLVSSPFTFIALASGMKEKVIVTLIPAGLKFLTQHRQIGTRIFALVLGLGFVLLLNDYSVFVRQANWYKKESTSNSITLVTSYLDHMTEKSFEESMEESLESLLGRVNPMTMQGMTVAFTLRPSIIPPEIFNTVFAAFIPRWLWPEKPLIAPGAEQTRRLHGLKEGAAVTTSTAAGLFAELYFAGGFTVFLAVSVLLGWVISLMQRITLVYGNIFTAKAFFWMLFWNALRLNEMGVIYVLTGYVIFMVYLFAVTGMMFVVGKVSSSTGNG